MSKIPTQKHWEMYEIPFTKYGIIKMFLRSDGFVSNCQPLSVSTTDSAFLPLTSCERSIFHSLAFSLTFSTRTVLSIMYFSKQQRYAASLSLSKALPSPSRLQTGLTTSLPIPNLRCDAVPLHEDLPLPRGPQLPSDDLWSQRVP